MVSALQPIRDHSELILERQAAADGKSLIEISDIRPITFLPKYSINMTKSVLHMRIYPDERSFLNVVMNVNVVNARNILLV